MSLKETIAKTSPEPSPEMEVDFEVEDIRRQFGHSHLHEQAKSIQSQLHSTRKRLSKALNRDL